jgi:hypothetical protein
MTISARPATSLQHAIAFGIAAVIALGTAGACRAAAHPPANPSETGWQGELVNRPGCWSAGGYDIRYACEASGRH